jgi:hypothetical protein
MCLYDHSQYHKETKMHTGTFLYQHLTMGHGNKARNFN